MVSVHGAPTMTLEGRRLSSPPKWVNPCGLAAEDFTGDLDVVQLTDSQLLHQVVVQAKTASTHAKLFRDDYVSTMDHSIGYLSFALAPFVMLPSQKWGSKILENVARHFVAIPETNQRRLSSSMVR